MAEARYAMLAGRGVLRVTGTDARPFLQGLITNDVTRLSPERALYAALLTPQGKFLHDFFLVEIGDAIVIDCEGERREDLALRLSRYKLRADVAIADVTETYAIAAVFGAGAAAALGLDGAEGTEGTEETEGAARAFAGGIVYVDPRERRAGLRALLARPGAEAALAAAGLTAGPWAEYERLRLSLGLADGSRDMTPERALPLEYGLDARHAIDWDKGCYLGQEPTARTRYRGRLRKRLVTVAVTGPLPAPGTPVTLEGRAVGEMRSGRDGIALALLRGEAVAGAGAEGPPLTAGAATLRPRDPVPAEP